MHKNPSERCGVYLYNEYFSFLPRLKKFFGKPGRGPESVFKSLAKGLDELKFDYRVNHVPLAFIEMACVLSGTESLKWAIGQKTAGKIKKLIAGPNIVIEPGEGKGILKSSEIDKILVPSQWVKDFYISLAPELSSKIGIWPAGVDVLPIADEAKVYDFLIFTKLGASALAADVKILFDRKNKKYKEIIYGKFRHEEYFKLIEKSKFVIYLSESESQGLAMFEAWARNVPTLVWERGFLQYKNYRWEGNTATPYLTTENGRSFKDFEDFKKVLPEFEQQTFSPREWVENNASNKIAAQKYLEIASL